MKSEQVLKIFTLDTDLLGKDVNNLPVTDPSYVISR